MKRYNLINNSLGWFCFIVAAVTYLMTLEPTASFWDCPEFISQGFKLEVGHPPGNPIFMLTARFFVTIFGGGAETAAIAVNSMSALLSAGTILLMFWTITHLVRKLTVKDDASEISWLKTMVIMGAGLCGSLMYTWSDTFWFSAVEGEVYAFSSFCTALVFWLILKWENRADQPHSDRYLILIAYVIGISIAVHLLNLLCIPAIVLVFYYRKYKNINLVGSLCALGVSVVIIGLILYGLVPGFIEVAQGFELFFVNMLGFGYNIGVLIYAICMVGVLCWAAYELYRQNRPKAIRWSVFLSVVLSGMLMIGHGWVIPVLLTIAFGSYIFVMCKKIPVRIFNVGILSILVIFIGYSSYALLLIRANAETPMNQNAPDNVFALSSYLNREQYGDRPLFYGPSFAEKVDWQETGQKDDFGNPILVAEVDKKGYPKTAIERGIVYEDGEFADDGENVYTKVAKTSADQPDRYVREQHSFKPRYSSGMSMLFTRIYSSNPMHVSSYKTWSQYENPDLENIPRDKREEWAARGYVTNGELNPYLASQTEIDLGTDESGHEKTEAVWVADFGTNMRYFINYQLNHMYWRYFMWNFAGRQNDYQSQGEPYLGNWISGIPAIDNARLGDQSLLPDQYGKDNPGHNVFYMLPLLLGIFGLLWQALKTHRYAPERGIEQFWVIFFLFFMTGIAIVLYLNQTPGQPRERDYAFAGSFYAFAIWVGMGVPAIASFLKSMFARMTAPKDAKAPATAAVRKLSREEKAAARQDALAAQWEREDKLSKGLKLTAAGIAVAIGIAVPLQVVSQTWDDHDRSGRYTARDFGMNYLNSLDPNAIIFVNGDNDTFPLWYAQEVEGCRTDVKVVNLSYLSTDWYANQIRSASYDATGVPMFASPTNYAYDQLRYINTSASNIYRMMASDVVGERQFAGRYYPMPANNAEAQAMAAEFLRRAEEAAKAVSYDKAFSDFYNKNMPGREILSKMYDVPYMFTYDNVVIPLDPKAIAKRFGRELPTDSLGNAYISGGPERIGSVEGRFSGALNDWLVYDIVSKSAAGNFARPVYFASTVGDSYYPGWANMTYPTGMAYQVTPFERKSTYESNSPVAAKAYDNIVGKFRWGGLDSAKPGKLYLDETVRNMVSSTRRSIIAAANDIMEYGDKPAPRSARDISRQKGLPVPSTYAEMAANLLELMQKKMPASVCPYENAMDLALAEAYVRLGIYSHNVKYLDRGRTLALDAAKNQTQFIRYAMNLSRDEAAKVNTPDRQALRYNLPQLIAMINFADLAQAILSRPISDESLTVDDQLQGLAEFVSTTDNLMAILYTYVIPANGKLRQQLLDDEKIGPYLRMVSGLNTIYKIDPQATVSKVTRTAGIDANKLAKLIDF